MTVDRDLNDRQPALHGVADPVSAHVAAAGARRRRGQAVQAARHARAALTVDAASVEAHNELALALRLLNNIDGAIDTWRAALAHAPASPVIHVNLGKALHQAGRPGRAVDTFSTAAEIAPDNADAWLGLGNARRATGDLDGAVTAYQTGLAAHPRDNRLLNNLGLTRQRLGDFEGAEQALRAAVAVAPDEPAGHKNLGMLHLLRGDLAAGFAEYEWRWQTRGRVNRFRPFAQPAWDGASLAGRTILAWGEQAVGDEIMFASLLPEVISAAGRCMIECEPRLVPLFARSFPRAEVFARANPPAKAALDPNIDVHAATGTMCRWLRPDMASFPAHGGYLTADAERVAAARARYGALGPGLKVGVSWRGGDRRFGVDRTADLSFWRVILQTPEIRFVNLQYGVCAADLAYFRDAFGVALFDDPAIDPLADLDAFAAAVAALDLIISIDNTTVHVAGALGAPVLTILGPVADWRWFLTRDDSPWYPSVRLFRQAGDDPAGPFAAVAALLKDRAAHG